MHVKELMTHPVVTCQIGDHLDVPARLMWEYDCGVIPVVGADGRLEGVITDRDITMEALTKGQRLDQLPIEGAMAKHVLVVHPEESVEGAERLMREGQVRRLPVVDNAGRPVGLVSINDLARLSAKARRSGVEHELVETFAAICQPRMPAKVRTVAAPSKLVTA
jgi:CBS domain-containing protein